MDRRAKFRKGLSGLYLPFYDALCDILPSEWEPYSGLRTFPEQDEIYAQGRTKPGKRVTDSRGGESPHNYGCATDWCLWDDGAPIWPGKSDKAWAPYLAAVEKVGLRSGSEWGDFPHNELEIKVRWPKILEALLKGGSAMAEELINASRMS